MQMSLMPENAPPLEGIEIAARCVPAKTVGGDFFDYLSLAGGRIGIALADVSGKGLRTAMNAVLANGMMHEIAKIEASCGDILSTLNANFCPRMEKYMFTALGLAALDKDQETLHWANAAQPHPIIKQDEQVSEFTSDGALPLGMTPNVTYTDWELTLRPGDVLIFYTDGIIEAENKAGTMYETHRLMRVLSRLDSDMKAAEIMEAIFQDVDDFVSKTEQYDDMTVVVVKKE